MLAHLLPCVASGQSGKLVCGHPVCVCSCSELRHSLVYLYCVVLLNSVLVIYLFSFCPVCDFSAYRPLMRLIVSGMGRYAAKFLSEMHTQFQFTQILVSLRTFCFDSEAWLSLTHISQICNTFIDFEF